MTVFHVSITGNDHDRGDEAQPLRTMQAAASRARPGDTVRVHAGVYREWVRPPWGGTSDAARVTFEAAPGEVVVISGAEVVADWRDEGDGTWSAELPDSLFGQDNPYRDCLRGDWFISRGREHHRGEIYRDGLRLHEVASREDLAAAAAPEAADGGLPDPERHGGWWWVEPLADRVRIHARFRTGGPTGALVEAMVRPACFYPDRPGVNYITLRGFEIRHAATPWAPPTAEQVGAVGPHWSKGWIIEKNRIHSVKCTGLSLGKERATGQNEWTELGVKHGSQREREVIFRALAAGWSRETVGSHVVRDNEIHDCGQAGICGHLGGVFSRIEGNHIHHVCVEESFNGHEMGGIKIHAAIDMRIADNHIHNCCRGIWLDWQAQGARVTRNLLYNNDASQDFYIEVCHGPCMVDHNLMLSAFAIKDCSQGTAFAHNLVGGLVKQQPIPNRFTPYHIPHSTAVLGVMTILGGDNRYHNNLFIPPVDGAGGEAGRETVADENAHLVPAGERGANEDDPFGLCVYDESPVFEDDWCTGGNVNAYARMKLPVMITGNAYYNEARPYARETAPFAPGGGRARVELVQDGGRLALVVDLEEGGTPARGALVTTETLGACFQVEAPYEDADGSPLCLNRDYLGQPRAAAPIPGPFEDLKPGVNRFALPALRLRQED